MAKSWCDKEVNQHAIAHLAPVPSNRVQQIQYGLLFANMKVNLVGYCRTCNLVTMLSSQSTSFKTAASDCKWSAIKNSTYFYDLNQCICINKANGSNEIALYTMLSTVRLGNNTSTAEWHMTQQVMPHEMWYNGNTWHLSHYLSLHNEHIRNGYD